MDLGQKLSQISREERPRYFRKKLRELRLVHAVDRLTDRHHSLSSLGASTLRLMQKFFKNGVSALLFADCQARHRQFFLTFGLPENAPTQTLYLRIKELLHAHLQPGNTPITVNEPEQSIKELGLSRYAIFPFFLNKRLGGCLFLGNRSAPFDEEDLHYLQAISSQLDNALLYSQFLEKFRKTRTHVTKQSRELNFMYEISLSLGKEEDFASMTRRILESTLQLVEVNRCSFMLYNPISDELKTEFCIGAPAGSKSAVRMRMGEGVAGLALKEGRPILARRGAGDSRFVPFEPGETVTSSIANLACVPLISNGTPLGVLNFSSTRVEKSISPDEMETLEIVSHLIIIAWQRQRLYQLSIKDELTGLYTFRFFQQRLQEELARSRRYGGDFSLVLFDLDHFKKLNDTWGHLSGNMALKGVAEILRESIRQGIDLSARFGGEEFALILPGTSRHQALILAERIRKSVEALVIHSEGQEVRLSISGGITSFPGPTTLEEVINEADQALYAAKEGGRNQIRIAGEPSPV